MHRSTYDPDCGLDIATTTLRRLEDIASIHTWGYRLVVHDDGEHFIHEAYYGHLGALLGIALAPAKPCGDTAEAVRESLAHMLESFDEPVLRYAEFAARED